MAGTSLNENRRSLLIWKISNLWQSKLRKLLKNKNLNFNEYLILETLFYLMQNDTNLFISQKDISNISSIDNSVVSSKILTLENKKFISKFNSQDRRSNSIKLTLIGEKLINSLIKNVEKEEDLIFEKLGIESENFLNSLKLILGKKIRIKAK
tara:strand:- start:237 stop:695 length:459 start_codon:yes stop_codon:yes gene_type:complete